MIVSKSKFRQLLRWWGMGEGGWESHTFTGIIGSRIRNQFLNLLSRCVHEEAMSLLAFIVLFLHVCRGNYYVNTVYSKFEGAVGKLLVFFWQRAQSARGVFFQRLAFTTANSICTVES